jgi:hypothetical protein
MRLRLIDSAMTVETASYSSGVSENRSQSGALAAAFRELPLMENAANVQAGHI